MMAGSDPQKQPFSVQKKMEKGCKLIFFVRNTKPLGS